LLPFIENTFLKKTTDITCLYPNIPTISFEIFFREVPPSYFLFEEKHGTFCVFKETFQPLTFHRSIEFSEKKLKRNCYHTVYKSTPSWEHARSARGKFNTNLFIFYVLEFFYYICLCCRKQMCLKGV